MRTEKVVKNITYDYIGNILTIIIGFVSKTVFIYTLGQEYLGLSGLFSNVLAVLSLAELGISSAITYELYKPLSEEDHVKLYALMKFYKKAYQIIGFVILILGLCIVPFLKYIINFESKVEINYTLLYFLFLINTVFSYWFNAYKSTILIASQKKYLTKKIEYYCITVQTLIQMFMLLVFKSYILYLIIGIGRSIIQNWLVSLKANNEFPILKEKKDYKINNKEKSYIYKNIYALSLYKVSGVILNSTDNIIISMFISTNVLACYSLYNYLLSSLKSFLSIIFDSFVAAIGDFNTTESSERKFELFNIIYFLSFILFGMVSIGMINGSSLFILLWSGKEYLMNNSTVILMVIAFFITGLENATYIFRTACGLYTQGQYRPVLSALVNLIASIILVQCIGIDGVFIGTIISRLVTYWVIDPKIVYNHLFKRSVIQYYFKWFGYFFVVVITTISSLFINSLFIVNNWGVFIVKGIISEMIFLCFIVLIYRNNKEYQYLVEMLCRFLKIRGA